MSILVINFGEESTRHQLGWTVNFCPICRDVQQTLLFQVDKTTRISSITVGADTVGYLAFCGYCQTYYGESDPERYGELAAEAQQIEAHLKVLPQEALTALIARARVEERFRTGTLASEERLVLVAEPLRAMEAFFRPENSPSAIGLLTVLALIFTVLGTMVPLFVTTVPRWEIGCMVAIAGIALLVLSLARDGRVAIRKGTELPLVRAYANLRPELHELQQVTAQLREEGQLAGKKVSPERLYAKAMAASGSGKPLSENFRMLLR